MHRKLSVSQWLSVTMEHTSDRECSSCGGGDFGSDMPTVADGGWRMKPRTRPPVKAMFGISSSAILLGLIGVVDLNSCEEPP